MTTVTYFLELDPYPFPGARTEPYLVSPADRIEFAVVFAGDLTVVKMEGHTEPWSVTTRSAQAIGLHLWPEWRHPGLRAS